MGRVFHGCFRSNQEQVNVVPSQRPTWMSVGFAYNDGLFTCLRRVRDLECTSSDFRDGRLEEKKGILSAKTHDLYTVMYTCRLALPASYLSASAPFSNSPTSHFLLYGHSLISSYRSSCTLRSYTSSTPSAAPSPNPTPHHPCIPQTSTNSLQSSHARR